MRFQKATVGGIALLLSFSQMLAACEKKQCWKCSTKTHTTTDPVGTINIRRTDTTTTTVAAQCDKTASQIRDLETTTSSFRQSGNIYISTTQQTSCEAN